MRIIIVNYVLFCGQRGQLHCMAPCTVDAVLQVLDMLGSDVRSASARPVARHPQASA